MQPLRDLGPAMDTFAMVDAGRPRPSCTWIRRPRCRTPAPATMLGELDAEAIDRFVAAAGPGSGSPLVSAEIRHLGGALAPAAAGTTAPWPRSTPTS